MKKQLLSALIGFSALALVGSANASTVTVDASYAISGTSDNTITTNGFLIRYYELAIGSLDTLLKLTLLDTNPENNSVAYYLYEDLNSALSAGNTGSLLQTFTTVDNLYNFVQWSLLSGHQYLLGIDPGGRTANTYTSINSVPLPGAVLLFGSALLGAGVFGRKNKADKNKNFAAVAA